MLVLLTVICGCVLILRQSVSVTVLVLLTVICGCVLILRQSVTVLVLLTVVSVLTVSVRLSHRDMAFVKLETL